MGLTCAIKFNYNCMNLYNIGHAHIIPAETILLSPLV